MRDAGPTAVGRDVQPVGWLRRDLREAPAAVWAAVALHLMLLVLYTTLQPPFRGLDETAHIDMVLSLPNPLDWPAPGEKVVDQRLWALYDDAQLDGLPFARLPREEAELPKDERPSFAEAGTSDVEAVNQMVQHPPLYYLLTAAGMQVVPGTESWPYDRQIALMRWLSLLMVFPLPLLCWLAARRLGLGTAAGVVAAFVPLTMPSVQRVGSSVSNDALLILLIAGANVLAMAAAAGDLRRRTSVALGLVSAAALLTKGLALVLLVVIVLAYAVAAFRARAVRPVVVPAGIAAGLAGVVGGWWYLRNVLLYGSVQPNGYPGGALPYPPRQGGGFGQWWPDYRDQMLFRFWSALGHPEPPELDEDLATRLSIGLLVLLLLALVVAHRRRTLVVVALLPFAGLLALVALGSYANFSTYDRLIGAQGRYLYPALAGMSAAVAVLLHRVPRKLVVVVPLVVLGFAGWVQYLAAEAVIETFWTPKQDPEALAPGFDTLETWSPLPELLVRAIWVSTVLAGVVTAVAAALLVREAWRRAEPEPAVEQDEPVAV